MLLPLLALSAISLSLVKLGTLIVWVQVLTSIIKFAMLVIGLLSLTLLWQTLRRRR